MGEEFTGIKIPTVEQLICLTKDKNIILNFEIKSGIVIYEDIELKLIDMIYKHKIHHKVILSSFNHYSLAKCNEISSEIRTGILYMEGLYKPYNYAKTLGANAIHPHFYAVNEEVIKEAKKHNIKTNVFTGNRLFAISVIWSIYNAFVPKMLSNFISSTTIIGFIMTIDNYFALFLQPAVGIMSDKIDTKYGKRMPFIMVGMPLSVVFIIMLANYKNLPMLITFIVLMNLSMSIFRSPVVALMPDITAKENRSKANSIINLMGGIGSVIAYIVGSKLWDKDVKFPFYLSAICSYFIGFAGIETLFTLYGEKYLGIKTSAAAFSFTFISISFLISAIPAAIVFINKVKVEQN